MSLLRVLLAAAPAPLHAVPWTLCDDAGRVVQRGRDPPDRWPSAAQREAVLAADRVRIVALTLPPMPPARVAAAATYALEDRLAALDGPPALGISAPRSDGSVLAVVTARTLVDTVAASMPRFARVIAEPSLAPVHAGWAWYAGGAGGGFVRTADGGAFAVGAAPDDGPLPAELAAALTQAARSGNAPREVTVAAKVPADALQRWREATGIAFVPGEAWAWDSAGAAAYGAATDVLQRGPAPGAPRGPGLARLLRPALLVAAAALVLHVAATLAQWSWLSYDAWRNGRDVIALAQQAGINDATTPDAAFRALAARDAALRHASGQAAAGDALPLLARAAPALAALPPAAVKAATFADSAWTIELAALDDAARANLDHRLRDAGLVALSARSGPSTRVRVSLAP